MRENQDVKLEKWQREVGILEDIRNNLEEYSKLKDEKGEKDDIDRLNAKIANAIEDNSWARLEWGSIKRGKTSRKEGLEKIEKKITDRRKKIDERKAANKAETAKDEEVTKAIEKAVNECQIGSTFYNWAYGEMEVVAIDGEYIYLKVLDKKGCKTEWIDKNNAQIIEDSKQESVKEFATSAIGEWLFTKKEKVKIPEGEQGHKIFK